MGFISTSAGEIGSSGLSGSLLSRHNPLTRSVGFLARLQPRLVEGVRRVAGDVIWAVTRSFAYGDRNVEPWLVDLVDTMISANAVDALTDFVDTVGSHDRLAALPALSNCEVLVAAGDADRVIPFAHTERIAAELPHAELVRFAGAGHLPMLEQPAEMEVALTELLRRSAAWLPNPAAMTPEHGGPGRRPRSPPTTAGPRGRRDRRGSAASGRAPGAPRAAQPRPSVPLDTELLLPDTADTEALGERLAAGLGAGDLVVLSGPLGAGKTALVRGLARGLGVAGPVTSPTFVIAREHRPLPGGAGVPMVHVDAYRLGARASTFQQAAPTSPPSWTTSTWTPTSTARWWRSSGGRAWPSGCRRDTCWCGWTADPTTCGWPPCIARPRQ